MVGRLTVVHAISPKIGGPLRVQARPVFNGVVQMTTPLNTGNHDEMIE
jgi:hypothetical protein